MFTRITPKTQPKIKPGSSSSIVALSNHTFSHTQIGAIPWINVENQGEQRQRKILQLVFG
jgi:hypothetical protein